MLRVCGLYSLEIIFRSRGEPELCADEILKDRAIIAADCAMRFVANNQLEICGRELGQEAIARGKALNRCHNYLRLFPILPPLFVNNCLDSIVRQVIPKVSLRLPFEFQPIDQKKNARRIFGAEIKLRDRRAQQRLSRASCHFEKESILSICCGVLKGTNCLKLVIAEQTNLFIYFDRLAIGRGIT